MPSFNINRVVVVGRLTRDPELRSLPTGSSVCELRITCNSRFREPDGEYGERPNYFDVSVYGAAAEVVSTYTGKGAQVAVDGRLSWREWETAEETKRQAVSIVAETVQFLERAPRREADAEDGQDGAELAGVGAGGGDLAF